MALKRTASIAELRIVPVYKKLQHSAITIAIPIPDDDSEFDPDCFIVEPPPQRRATSATTTGPLLTFNDLDHDLYPVIAQFVPDAIEFRSVCLASKRFYCALSTEDKDAVKQRLHLPKLREFLRALWGSCQHQAQFYAAQLATGYWSIISDKIKTAAKDDLRTKGYKYGTWVKQNVSKSVTATVKTRVVMEEFDRMCRESVDSTTYDALSKLSNDWVSRTMGDERTRNLYPERTKVCEFGARKRSWSSCKPWQELSWVGLVIELMFSSQFQRTIFDLFSRSVIKRNPSLCLPLLHLLFCILMLCRVYKFAGTSSEYGVNSTVDFFYRHNCF
jgi:hypothetical protein